MVVAAVPSVLHMLPRINAVSGEEVEFSVHYVEITGAGTGAPRIDVGNTRRSVAGSVGDPQFAPCRVIGGGKIDCVVIESK